jgi:hypothetical protein
MSEKGVELVAHIRGTSQHVLSTKVAQLFQMPGAFDALVLTSPSVSLSHPNPHISVKPELYFLIKKPPEVRPESPCLCLH